MQQQKKSSSNLWLILLEIALEIVILVLVVLIYLRLSKERFDNCFGMQYYGGGMLKDKNKPVCAEGTTKPLYPEGGCAEYDPETVSQEYREGKFTPAV